MTDIPLRKIDHIRFFVGNARQSAFFYRNAFGFDVIAYAGLETKVKHEAGYVLKQGEITFVLTSPLSEQHPESRRLVTHGDGVMDIALDVPDVRAAFEETVKRGAAPVRPPEALEDDSGVFETASIRAYGDTTHTFINRDRYRGVFAPGYRPIDPERYQTATERPVGLAAIDHVVANVEEGKMNEWVEFYRKVLGFNQLVSFDDKDISTEYSALMSKVVQNGTGRIKFPINEPAAAKRRSQIDEYLQFYGGPGVQHIALITGDIVKTVRAMRANDVSFLRVPRTYYDTLSDRVGAIKEDVEELADLGILVDKDDEGYMLQIFTKPVADRPTLFFEVIQRRGSKSFGKGNFKALFEAIEREQDIRGTL
ncbi:4-hydroxyphenylpyruvate dioxygenase [Frigoriglobus tundricola]|uniref:4-hydroxyphenylpyruvate dioxygenase n=1 Tax=Frigoriglobus tundricola TaxID=2774151 RepID=A0A6M5YGM9_9BACT|nr:4-hydroxyphenylpyruvate dioxygenase [Frigoriglobus tundricola]QJW93175.1 4-hydroxyphenylpyruvate dioxygenase [Frigoriglobus tundricola]